jgi:hypothetical protein
MPKASGRKSRHARRARNSPAVRPRNMKAVATPLITKIRSIRQRFTKSIGSSIAWVV